MEREKYSVPAQMHMPGFFFLPVPWLIPGFEQASGATVVKTLDYERGDLCSNPHSTVMLTGDHGPVILSA